MSSGGERVFRFRKHTYGWYNLNESMNIKLLTIRSKHVDQEQHFGVKKIYTWNFTLQYQNIGMIKRIFYNKKKFVSTPDDPFLAS